MENLCFKGSRDSKIFVSIFKNKNHMAKKPTQKEHEKKNPEKVCTIDNQKIQVLDLG